MYILLAVDQYCIERRDEKVLRPRRALELFSWYSMGSDSGGITEGLVVEGKLLDGPYENPKIGEAQPKISTVTLEYLEECVRSLPQAVFKEPIYITDYDGPVIWQALLRTMATKLKHTVRITPRVACVLRQCLYDKILVREEPDQAAEVEYDELVNLALGDVGELDIEADETEIVLIDPEEDAIEATDKTAKVQPNTKEEVLEEMDVDEKKYPKVQPKENVSPEANVPSKFRGKVEQKDEVIKILGPMVGEDEKKDVEDRKRKKEGPKEGPQEDGTVVKKYFFVVNSKNFKVLTDTDNGRLTLKVSEGDAVISKYDVMQEQTKISDIRYNYKAPILEIYVRYEYSRPILSDAARVEIDIADEVWKTWAEKKVVKLDAIKREKETFDEDVHGYTSDDNEKKQFAAEFYVPPDTEEQPEKSLNPEKYTDLEQYMEAMSTNKVRQTGSGAIKMKAMQAKNLGINRRDMQTRGQEITISTKGVRKQLGVNKVIYRDTRQTREQADAAEKDFLNSMRGGSNT